MILFRCTVQSLFGKKVNLYSLFLSLCSFFWSSNTQHKNNNTNMDQATLANPHIQAQQCNTHTHSKIRCWWWWVQYNKSIISILHTLSRLCSLEGYWLFTDIWLMNSAQIFIRNVYRKAAAAIVVPYCASTKFSFDYLHCKWIDKKYWHLWILWWTNYTNILGQIKSERHYLDLWGYKLLTEQNQFTWHLQPIYALSVY